MVGTGQYVTVASLAARTGDHPERIDEATRAAFGARRPTVTELRVLQRLLAGTTIGREDLDTAAGRVIARLRTIGVVTNSHHEPDRAQAPCLTADARFALMLDELPDIAGRRDVR